ncbi:unnamed protein product [Oppiella nova]|uniref:Uncharacterized protein n=1 Tax=Oppiella nova TaxID=334625 RepID=A0A7R9LZQ3_9ACAR|nr:unnamed protein product [Oppiella nova]CAG2168517.1 unnamed protein product [Oppiella nova]
MPHLLDSIVTDPDIDLLPDFDPHDSDPKYVCCLKSIAVDCLSTVGKVDCTADEVKTMSHIMDEVIVKSDAGECKAYPYVHGLETCKK